MSENIKTNSVVDIRSSKSGDRGRTGAIVPGSIPPSPVLADRGFSYPPDRRFDGSAKLRLNSVLHFAPPSNQNRDHGFISLVDIPLSAKPEAGAEMELESGGWLGRLRGEAGRRTRDGNRETRANGDQTVAPRVQNALQLVRLRPISCASRAANAETMPARETE